MLVYGALVLGPPLALVLGALGSAGRDIDPMGLALAPERLGLLARSAFASLCVAGLGVGIGTLAATWLYRRRTGLPGLARWAMLALAAVPWYVHALAWSRLMSALAGAVESLGLPPPPTTGTAIAVWVQAMALLPLAAGLSLIAVESVGSDLVDAGRTLAGDGAVIGRIVVPLARPALVAVAAVLFVLSLLDYSVPALFQVNVYALAVFARYSAGNDPVEALVTALPMIALAAVAAWLAQRGLRRVAQWAPRSVRFGASPMRPAAPLRTLQGVAVVVLAAQIVVPAAGLVDSVGSGRALSMALSASRPEVMASAAVAALVAAACLPLALLAASGLARTDGLATVWWLLVAAPLALPGSLVGVGLIATWNRSFLPQVYGSLAMPVLAGVARFAPFAAMVVFAQEQRVDPDLIDAARVHQRSALDGWLRVRLPLLLPGLVAAACVAFVLALGELPATVIVMPPGVQTLTLRIYNYMHYGASDAVAALCLAMTVVVVLVAAAGSLALAGWRRGRGPAGGPA